MTGENFSQPGEREMQCLALYLRDWLGSTPGVLVMDQAQYAALLSDVMDPALTSHPPYSLGLFTRYAPLDAAIRWSWENGKLTCGLCRASGEKTLIIACNGSADLPRLMGGVTDWLCAELGLDKAATPIARGLTRGDSAALQMAYVLRHFRVIWYNPGSTKLKALRPFMNEARTNPVVAGAFFQAGLQMGGHLLDEPAAPLIRLLSQVLPFVLSTDQEDLAIRFLRTNRLERAVLENDLLEFVKSAGKSDADKALELLAAPDKPKAGRADLIKDTSMIADAAANTVGRQCGALRCLGVLRSEKVKPHLIRAGKAEDAQVRAAVAYAWGQFDAPAGAAELKTLAADPDALVAFTAATALAARGQGPGNLVALARSVLRADPRQLSALQAMARAGDVADAPLLQARAADPDPARRTLALEGLVRLGRISAEESRNWLRDPDTEVVQAAIRLLPQSTDAAFSQSLIALANHPDWRFAEAARIRLLALLPTDPRERRLRELATEHPYVRGQIIEALAQEASPAALDDLEVATRNADAHTRALALQRLAEKAPERACRHIERLVADPHVWVRLHAAAVAAQCAEAAQAPALKIAADSEKDEATRLWLLDGLARAQGRPLPPAQPAVNRLSADRNTPFLCGHGPDAPTTPFQGYYDLNVHADDAAKAAHANGKIFLARSNKTTPNPAQVVLSREWRDECWRAIDEEFAGALPWLDGVVLGEESMSFGKSSAWANGWRLFCREAKLDPLRIAGKLENLSTREKQAWLHWEQRVSVEGFNTLYDVIKLRYGKLRPGFAVCTFMPDQNGPTDFDRMWKFDIGAGYYYQINNRYRYTQIRRFKTLWPDRPVLWLVNGVSTNSGGQGGVKYTAKMPTTPLPVTSMQAYADAVCAWLAGAHTGNFTGYLFMDKNMKDGMNASGLYVFIEDLHPGSSSLQRGIALAFNGVEELYRTKAAIKELKPDIQIGKNAPADNTTLDEPKAKTKDRFALRVEAEMKQMETGFLLDAKQDKDCARLLTDLPFPAHSHAVLLVGDITASKGALRLPNDYDFLDSIGKLGGQELASYRLIAVANSDQALLRDDTVSNVTAWLKSQPGLLYVYGSLSMQKLATPQDLGEKLQQPWPWADDVALAEKHYRISGPSAVALAGEASQPKLVFWRGEGFRGGVLFDCGDLPPAELREHLNRLAAEKQAGIKLDGPIGMEAGAVDGLTAMVSCRAAPETFTLKGVDLFAGLIDPALAKSRSAAMVAESFKGRYVASFNGVSVLADQPLELAEPVDGGMRVRCRGLVQVVGSGGAVSVQIDGESPPVITDAGAAVDWIVYKQTPGIAEYKRDGGGTVTYLRLTGTMILKNPRTLQH
jgi:hypothetical protein